jgi:hypothetical protein
LNGRKVGSNRSAAPFTIEVVKLTASNGRETLFPGQMQPVSWETHGTNGAVAEVRMYDTKDGETTWSLIAIVPASPGRYDDWTVSLVSRTRRKCKVKVVLIDDRGIGSESTRGIFFIVIGRTA